MTWLDFGCQRSKVKVTAVCISDGEGNQRGRWRGRRTEVPFKTV